MSNFLAEESIFESDPSTNECEVEWFKAMERIDPAGLVSRCVCERERKRERKKEREREGRRERERERERERK